MGQGFMAITIVKCTALKRISTDQRPNLLICDMTQIDFLPITSKNVRLIQIQSMCTQYLKHSKITKGPLVS